MKKFLFIFLATTSLQAAAPTAAAPLFDESQTVVVNNRVLLKINGKPISVMDVVRKMDLIFYRQFPELSSSAAARYQFYTSGWEAMLRAVIDDHLIMADADEKKIEVSEGEVREELEVLFGPDVVLNLDKLGLTLSEALELLKMELTVQRMNMVMVRSKAMAEVPPKKVRRRYEEMLKDQPPQDQWVYQILSVRGENHEQAAQEAYQLLHEHNVQIDEVAEQLSIPNVDISLSDEYTREDDSLSLAYRAVLQTLSAGTFSVPISKDSVSRIFYLKKFEEGKPVPFNDVAEKIKQELTQEIAAKYNEAYRLKLRKHYGITEGYLNRVIPDDFRPFALR